MSDVYHRAGDPKAFDVDSEEASLSHNNDRNSKPTKKRRKLLVILGLVVIILVVAVVAGLVWHEQPSFCNAICHDPMDSYVEGYYSDDTSLLVSRHANEGITCLQCHVPTLEQQIGEATSWISGNFDSPLRQRQVDNEFCGGEGCHGDGTMNYMAEQTADMEINPHDNHMTLGGQCRSCHSMHRDAQELSCLSCHSEVELGFSSSLPPK